MDVLFSRTFSFPFNVISLFDANTNSITQTSIFCFSSEDQMNYSGGTLDDIDVNGPTGTTNNANAPAQPRTYNTLDESIGQTLVSFLYTWSALR